MSERQHKKKHGQEPVAGASSLVVCPSPHDLFVLMACVAGIMVVVLWVHWPALSTQALSFDDSEYMTQNRLVQQPGWGSARRFLSEVLEPSTVHGYYQPLTMITLMLDYAAGGRPDQLRPFHRTSLLLHVANTVLVVVLLYQLFGHALAAAAVGLLFGVHPMTVETIVWVGERKTVLAAFFALLSLVAYVRYTRSGGWMVYGMCLGAFVLALMSKPTATPLAACMLLLDCWPLRRVNRWSDLKGRVVLEKIPLLIIALISAYITYESQKRTAVTVLPGASGHKPLLLVLCHNIVFYLWHIVWPVNLSSHYPPPYPMNLRDGNVLAGVIGTALLIPLLLVSLRWTRAFLVGWLYFFVAIFPTLGVIGFTNVIAADKFAYLPSIGLMLPMVYVLSKAWGASRGLNLTLSRAGIVGTVAIAAVLLGFGTRAYLAKWTDTETLFRYMVSRSPQAAAPNIYLGLTLHRQGKYDEAIAYHRTAIEAAPAYHGSYFNLGNSLMAKGEVDDAIGWYKRALNVKADFADGHNNLGNAWLHKGDRAAAKKHYLEAIDIDSDFADAHYNLANVLRDEGRTEEAIWHYQETVRINPDEARAHKNLGIVLARQGDIVGAVYHYCEALRCRPDWWAVANSLAWIYATSADLRLQDPVEAIRWAQHAARFTGRQRPEVLGTLAVAYGEGGQRQLARQTAEEAIQLAIRLGRPQLVDDIRARMGKYFPGGSIPASPARQSP